MSKHRARDNPSPCEDMDTEFPAPDLANQPSDSSGTLFPLLRWCLGSDEPDAWAELFLLVEQTAAPPVRSVLHRFGVSEREIEAVVLELFEELYLDDGKLRSFRGQNEAEFCAWLWQVATHFAQNWADQRQRAVAREKAALSRHGLPDRSGPDDETFRARAEEWRALMRPKDFDRLLVLIGWSTWEAVVCDRTRRRWEQQLLDKYPELFGDGRQARHLRGCGTVRGRGFVARARASRNVS